MLEGIRVKENETRRIDCPFCGGKKTFGIARLKMKGIISDVRRQGFSDFSDRFVTEALARFLFEFRRRQPGAATGVFGLSAF